MVKRTRRILVAASILVVGVAFALWLRWALVPRFIALVTWGDSPGYRLVRPRGDVRPSSASVTLEWGHNPLVFEHGGKLYRDDVFIPPDCPDPDSVPYYVRPDRDGVLVKR